MSNDNKRYKRPFSSFVKKQSKPFRAAIEDEVNHICSNPLTGELKIGDLSNIRIHKFNFNKKQYLIAYSYKEQDKVSQENSNNAIQFYQIGSHENFYEYLKSYLRSIGWYK